MIVRYIGMGLLCLWPLLAIAQPEEPVKTWRWGLEWSSSLSYTGLGSGLTGQWQQGRHLAYAGPRLLVSDSYVPGQGPWGLQLGYQYHWVREGRWQSFVNIDYQLSWYQPYNPQQLPVSGRNRVHEFHLAYGIQYQLGPPLYLGSTLGVGGYLEQLLDVRENQRRSYRGYSNLLRLFVRYVLMPSG